jgi:hypothetical protein
MNISPSEMTVRGTLADPQLPPLKSRSILVFWTKKYGQKYLEDLMSERIVQADYLIIGAGASAMAFADEILTHSSSSLAIVDRRDSPGGHWNDAYPLFDCTNRQNFTASTPVNSVKVLNTSLE